MSISALPLSAATFVVTRVSDRKHESKPKFRKDTGEQFVTYEWALTLMPTLESGFSTDLEWTFWTSSDDVANVARSLIEMQQYQVKNDDGSVKVIREPRLAFLNGPRDFVKGDVKPNENSQYRDRCPVWFANGCEPDFGIVEMPRAKGSGNIRELKSLLGITTKPEKAESVEPATGDNDPF
jgi:hypothetical protein